MAKRTKDRPFTKPEHFGIAEHAGMFISTDAPMVPDAEGRWPIEPFGFFIWAWLPTRCRNGKVRWLCSIQRHDDGTYTLGDNAR